MPTLHSSVLQDELAYASETLIDDDTTLNVVVMHTTIDDLYIYIYIYIHMLQSKGTTMKKNEKKENKVNNNTNMSLQFYCTRCRF